MLRSFKISKVGIFATIMVLVLSMLLAACGTQKESVSAVSEKPAETPAGLPEVKLTWYFPGAFPQADQDLIFAEVNKVLKAKINATVDFKPFGFGEYDQKMQVVIASGEPYDIAFTSNWMNNYSQNVAKGAFLPLDDLLAEYAPKTFAAVPKSFWDAAKVKGQIYGFINEQIAARTPAVVVSKEEAEKYKLDIPALSGKLNPDNLNQLEPFIESVKKDFPQKGFYTSLVQLDGLFFNLEPIAGIQIPGAVDFSDSTLTVVNQYETEGVKKYAALMRDWNAKGYLNSKDRISKKTEDGTEAKTGKVSVGIGGSYKPSGDVESTAEAGYERIQFPSGTAHLTTNGIIATMQAINRNSQNPERAMMLLELLNSDKELYNLLNFGIKDKHFKLDADGFMIKEGDEAKAYVPNVPWMFATNFLAYVEKGMPANVWEDTKKLNADALPSQLLGFSFDAEPVKAEIGKVSAIFDEYSRAIDLGVSTEAKYNEFLAKQKAAGADKIIAEMQKQIDAWKTTK
ncbi:ABC transporter substrate-binding protein [Paenibacillus eucommiae]|uniref:Aldouronate transport system substrate-binding protein n=1 Tax=Paenibacillus eucommiae TaxID=1355755 RepID=A0ABS4IMY3_9BACL|nr:ABC transporter substrate-binding protein [Paenibacillus eucommiae]MBP1988865.1 putative aldouronate transport system substrate-binding protein [Paenibacillus eucommiae]